MRDLLIDNIRYQQNFNHIRRVPAEGRRSRFLNAQNRLEKWARRNPVLNHLEEMRSLMKFDTYFLLFLHLNAHLSARNNKLTSYKNRIFHVLSKCQTWTLVSMWKVKIMWKNQEKTLFFNFLNVFSIFDDLIISQIAQF